MVVGGRNGGTAWGWVAVRVGWADAGGEVGWKQDPIHFCNGPITTKQPPTCLKLVI